MSHLFSISYQMWSKVLTMITEDTPATWAIPNTALQVTSEDLGQSPDLSLGEVNSSLHTYPSLYPLYPAQCLVYITMTANILVIKLCKVF